MDSLLYIVHLFNSGGLVMYPLVILSIIVIAIGIERYTYFKANTELLKEFSHDVYFAVKENDWAKAKELCAANQTATGRILNAGLKYSKNEASMKNAFSEQMMIEASHLKIHLDYLSAIVTISPLLGLLGTVSGMIGTFSILDSGSGASAISGGVGEALIATATGLLVAILSFCVYTYFSHRMDAIINDTETLSVVLLNGMKEQWSDSHVSK